MFEKEPTELEQNLQPEATPEVTPEKQSSYAQVATADRPQTTENIPEIQPAVQETPKVESSSKENNLRILRQRAERIERERDEAVQRLQEIEARSRAPEQAEEDYSINIGADDLAEGKHLNKISSKIKKLEDQIKGYQQQSSTMNAEARLKAEHADFDKVVSKENIDILKEAYPELALSLQSTPDLYTKAKSAYTLIKKLGIHTDENYDQERELVKTNAAKPKPLASVSPQQGDSPLSRANAFANGLTKELKEQLYKEMIESRKGY